MNINFSAWSIHRPLPAILGFTLLTIAGMFAFKKMPIGDLEVEIPAITINVGYPGATPSQMEAEVTRKIESAVANVIGIDSIRSNISEGSSFTFIEFDLSKDINVALDDTRDAMTRVRSQLPQDISEPLISRVQRSEQALLTYTLASSNLSAAELSWFLDDTITRDLLAVSGIGAVNRIGGVNREVRVDLIPEKLSAFGVTAAEISTQLRRVQTNRPGGRSLFAGGEQAIRTVSTAQDINAIRSLPILLSDGRRIHLSEVANVEDRFGDQRQMALLNGSEVIGFQISRAQGADAVSVAKESRQILTQLGKTNPNIQIKEVANAVNAMEDNYKSSIEMLFEGGVLAMIVVFVFLRDWRSTWVSAVALPLSVIPTYWVMSLFGYSLNTLTLLALTLVIGILVDDAIVEIENIVRHLRDGKSPKQAALDAASEIGLAVIATTLTLVAVFLPVAFMPGVPGRLFKQFAVTAVTAVSFSLLVARLLTPMIAAYQLRSFPKHEKPSAFAQRYLQLVHWTLDHRRRTMLAAALLFVIPMIALMTVPTGFMPSEERGQVDLSVSLAPGSRLADTLDTVQRVQKVIEQQAGAENVFASVGVDSANITIKLKPRKQRDVSQSEFQSALGHAVREVPGARFSFQQSGPGGGDRLSIGLSGDDPELLARTAEQVTRDIRTIAGIGIVSSNASLTRPEIRLVPDLERAAQLGVSPDTISEAIRIGTTGDVDFRLPKLDLPSRQIPIRVQLNESARNDLAFMRLLRVPTRNGSVPLESVVTATLSSGPAQIVHYDRARNVTVDVDLNGKPLGLVTAQVDKLPSMQNLPAGIQRVAAGQGRQMRQMMSGFILAMVLGVFCVYGVLVLLFNDVLQPLTILIALPMSIGGAVAGLLICGFPLAMPALIGLLMLMGIAVKNSILLVDYTVLAERRGLSRRDALIDACSKRARPIIMTSIAMAAGMLPVALNIGGGSGFRSPMAVAVIGGLITSTVLSLLVIPAAYTYIADFENWLRRLRRNPLTDQSQPVIANQ